ncbi:MAG: hypothetical protein WC716_16785 [Chitinophagaceae bacterium]|jgi:hypothetical protein
MVALLIIVLILVFAVGCICGIAFSYSKSSRESFDRTEQEKLNKWHTFAIGIECGMRHAEKGHNLQYAMHDEYEKWFQFSNPEAKKILPLKSPRMHDEQAKK